MPKATKTIPKFSELSKDSLRVAFGVSDISSWRTKIPNRVIANPNPIRAIDVRSQARKVRSFA